MSKLDDASWHYGGDDFPSGLADENGATHIGMFARWAIERGYWSDFLGADAVSAIQEVRMGNLSARSFILERCDGKLLSEMLTPDIAPFAEKFYSKVYFPAYRGSVANGLKSDYLVEETTENYRTMAQLLDVAIEKWRNKPWWKVW